MVSAKIILSADGFCVRVMLFCGKIVNQKPNFKKTQAMRKTILVYGLIAGLISAALMFISIPLWKSGVHSEIFGYATILVSMSMIFFGVRSYRDNKLSGTISFGKALGVGLLIAAIGSLIYALTWLFVYHQFFPDFTESYTNSLIEDARKSGADSTAIGQIREQGVQLKALYANPVTNVAITFLEPFPVGLLIALISAAILRRKPKTV